MKSAMTTALVFLLCFLYAKVNVEETTNTYNSKLCLVSCSMLGTSVKSLLLM